MSNTQRLADRFAIRKFQLKDVLAGAGPSRGSLRVDGKVGGLDVGDLLHAYPSAKWSSQH